MTLEAALLKLRTGLREFRDVLQGLELTVTHDRPEGDSVILVDQVGDTITEVDSLLREVLDAAEDALSAADRSLDAYGLRRSLAVAHERFLQLSRLVSSDLLGFEKISALVGFGRERGRGWMAWVATLRKGLESSSSCVDGCAEQFLRCWEELAERVNLRGISLHAANIGQQISSRETDPPTGAT